MDELIVYKSVYACNCFCRMRSEGSRFTLGVWGQGCVRQKLRLCPQPFATVCVRPVSSPQWGVRLEWSGQRVKLTRDAAVILAFAEEVFV